MMPDEAQEDRERELSPEEIEALLDKADDAGDAPPAEGAVPPPEDETDGDSSETKPKSLPRISEEDAAIALSELVEPEGGLQIVSPENLLEFLGDVPLDITIELGRASLTIGELISLREGAVVELDKIAGEPVDILANGRLIARGEVVVVNDYFSVRVTDIVSDEEADK